MRKEFQALSAPVLVVINDIDGLTIDEICLIFRLVKVNADFPNLIFLLLFQRDIAERALNNISGQQGRLFLEKIVQVGIDLPLPPANELAGLLFNGLNKILGPLVSEAESDHEAGRGAMNKKDLKAWKQRAVAPIEVPERRSVGSGKKKFLPSNAGAGVGVQRNWWRSSSPVMPTKW